MNSYLLAFLLLFVVAVLGQGFPVNSVYKQRFLTQYQKIHNPSNGYFGAQNVPYHSVETLMCEAPDYGHLSTSEAFSYWLWLESAYGGLTGNWSALNFAYSVFEGIIIQNDGEQPSESAYNPNSPATYAPEGGQVSDYPEELQFGCQVGTDPLYSQLQSAYGTASIYGTHWLVDVDNWYGYGVKSDGVSKNGMINTFQRGPEESVWKTIPQPEWEIFKWGGQWGFLDLFTEQSPPYGQQYRYTNAPDADARAIQALYWAWNWSSEQGNPTQLASNAAKLGDYLRYSMFDKYFKTIGSQTPCGSNSNNYAGFHGLLSWYYAWGGSLNPTGSWSWRIGCEYAHFGYQNPVAAWVLSTIPAFAPKSSNGVQDWAKSLTTQLNFYAWLQSAEGAIGGGATSSYNGAYDPYPPNATTFNNMAYVVSPVYQDPPSNSWIGWQAWSMERLAEYYFLTKDSKAGNVLNNWLPWALSIVNLTVANQIWLPGYLNWTGAPSTWTGSPVKNSNYHVVLQNGQYLDLGAAASFAHGFTYIAAATGNAQAKAKAKAILDTIDANYQDSIGVSNAEGRPDYCGNEWTGGFFNQEVYVPSGWHGNNAQGANIVSGDKFLDIRPKYKQDPKFAYVQQACQSGQTPTFNYHRFWAQSEYAIATLDYGRLFPSG